MRLRFSRERTVRRNGCSDSPAPFPYVIVASDWDGPGAARTGLARTFQGDVSWQPSVDLQRCPRASNVRSPARVASHPAAGAVEAAAVDAARTAAVAAADAAVAGAEAARAPAAAAAAAPVAAGCPACPAGAARAVAVRVAAQVPAEVKARVVAAAVLVAADEAAAPAVEAVAAEAEAVPPRPANSTSHEYPHEYPPGQDDSASYLSGRVVAPRKNRTIRPNSAGRTHSLHG
jgi:hypothetical protein